MTRAASGCHVRDYRATARATWSAWRGLRRALVGYCSTWTAPAGRPVTHLEEFVMAVGLGIVLIIVGLVLVLDVVNVNISFINDSALGWILLLAGVLALVVSLVINQQRTRTTTVVERREEPPVR
jgi:zinc transporter ZupT